MNVYAVKHIPTGLFMPQRNQARGSSNWTPGLPDSDHETTHMRIFPTMQAARCAMHSWLRGRVQVSRGGYGEDYEEDMKIIKDPTRRKQDVEVMIFTLVPVLTEQTESDVTTVQAAGSKVVVGIMGGTRFHGMLSHLNKE